MTSTTSSVRPNTIMSALGGNHKIPRIGRGITSVFSTHGHRLKAEVRADQGRNTLACAQNGRIKAENGLLVFQFCSLKRRALLGRRPPVLPAQGIALGNGIALSGDRPNGPTVPKNGEERLGRWADFYWVTKPSFAPQGVALGWENRAPSGPGWLARRNRTGM